MISLAYRDKSRGKEDQSEDCYGSQGHALLPCCLTDLDAYSIVLLCNLISSLTFISLVSQ
jgi:hypothetical protein